MALRKCWECGERISARARTCPHCGAPKKRPPSVLSYFFSYFFAIILLTVGSIAVCIKVGDGCMSFMDEAMKASKVARETGSGNDDGAWVYMKMFVEKRLSSPASADFPNWVSTKDVVTPLGGNRYRVKSYVDSENAFGVNIRQHFDGVIIDTGGGWKLESLDLHK